MNILEITQESLISLKANALRTLLSALGIIIGIASVISLMGLGAQSQANIENQIESLGANIVTLRASRGRSSSLTLSDLNSIKEDKRIYTVGNVSGEYSTNEDISYNGTKESTSIIGIEEDYFTMKDISLEEGSNFNNYAFSDITKQAIIGNSVAELLSLPDNPLDVKFKIGNNSFKVIGVLEEKSSAGFGQADINESIYVTLNTAVELISPTKYLSNIHIEAIDSDSVDAAKNQVGFLLLENHNITNPNDADFRFFSAQDILSTIGNVNQTLTNMLAGVAAISLIVGGIGIMNIMLVSVTERTKEIGLRKSLGAKKVTLVMQFLIESVFVTLLGGLIGIILGIIISYFLAKYLFKSDLVLDYTSIYLAFGVSTLIGLVFGIYPAKKASNLEPIEALRHE